MESPPDVSMSTASAIPTPGVGNYYTTKTQRAQSKTTMG